MIDKDVNFGVLMSLYAKERPEYLEKCLMSLSQQTLKADEIVCVFDGPVTSSLEDVVNKYTQVLNIKIVRLESNVGLGNALNEGLKYCSHDLVARMDTDDVCLPERFQQQLKCFEKDPHLVICGSSTVEYDEHMERITGYRKVPVDNASIKAGLRKRNPFNHMTVMFKKSDVLNSGGYIDHPLMEDYNLWIRLLASPDKKAINLPDELVRVRAGSSMLKRRSGINYILSEWKLFKLKREYNLQAMPQAVGIFIIRSAPRLLPTSLLTQVYKFLRKRKVTE